MPNDPLVSIGLPVYNGEKYLDEALKSLLAQSYKNFELIISDNCSTDKTSSICMKYKKKDKRIRYIRQKNNIGAVNNFNFVLNKSKGKYFMWAAHDDIWEPKFVQLIVNDLEKNIDAVLGVCGYYLFNNKNKRKILPEQKMKNLNKFESLIFFFNNSYDISIFFYGVYKTSVLKSIEGLHIDNRPFFNAGSDIGTIFKVLLQGPIVFVKKTLFYKRDTGDFLNIFSALRISNINSSTRMKILRYLTYYVFNYIDLYLFINIAIKSSLSPFEKLFISILSFRNFCIANWLFFKNLFFGVYFLIKNS